MNLLLDENLDEALAAPLSAVSKEDLFRSLIEVGQAGMLDADIPPLCKQEGIDALITVNHKDFGAKKFYYQALLEAGVSVVVIRPGKVAFDTLQQMAIISRHWKRIRSLLSESDGPVLIRVTQTDVKIRSLEDLIAEFEEGDPSLP